ncbi:MAG: deoxyuridine 5'-triphosphate nucleotidohydrolase [Bacilli bacterium]|nr:deoxyuridine 5'-triphosphate nucleotidohydrolase [Bacilli bacterium]
MARKFEKISQKQFIKDTNLTIEDYKNYNIPKRSTAYSAGYDFTTLEAFTVNPNETKLIPTGIKADMNKDEVLLLFIRSSLGFKYNIRMCNQTGVIDKDYYNNEDNEGHIFVKIKNEGEKAKEFKQGEKFVQGVFLKYLTTDNEEEILKIRKGGIGSTNDKH